MDFPRRHRFTASPRLPARFARRALAFTLACALLGASLGAQGLDYKSLLDAGSDSDSGSDSGSDSSLDLGKILNQQLLQQLLKASPSASPKADAAAAAKAVTPATPSPVYYYVCPLCGTSFPGAAPYKGVAWGYRLDLRMYGQIKDPPDAPLCPKCRFVIYKSTYDESELSRLRPYVSSAEYQGIAQRNTSYYYLAFLREKGMVKMKNGDYDIAHAYLQASWQAEDVGDKELQARYLERALFYVRRYAKSAKRDDPFFPTVKILCAEIERRLGRFTEAESSLRAIEKDEAFKAKYIQDIITSELAYIQVEDPGAH
jgi:hypothetical protein